MKQDEKQHLQMILTTMLNEIVQLKKSVAELSGQPSNDWLKTKNNIEVEINSLLDKKSS